MSHGKEFLKIYVSSNKIKTKFLNESFDEMNNVSSKDSGTQITGRGVGG